MNTPDGRFLAQTVSFVRRSPRLHTDQQTAWDSLRHTFVIDVRRGQSNTSVDPAVVFDLTEIFGREAPLIVEIGSGLGEAITHAAATHPEQNFLGIEVYVPGIATTLRRIGKRGLSNIRLLEANAPEVLAHSLPAASVSELWVFFPDPWPKTRHHKRRLLSPSFIALAERVLMDDGVLRIATDWQNYADHISQTLADAVHLRPLNGAEGQTDRFSGRVITSFERKAHVAGRTISDFAYQRLARNQGPQTEQV